MDFTPSDAYRDISGLADRILADHCAPDTLRQAERDGEQVAGAAWDALAHADLLGLAVPEEHGGSGLGLVEAAAVARQVGRHVAPVPYWVGTAAALAVARWAGPELRDRLLPGALDGTAPLTLALWQPVPAVDGRPTTLTATPTDNGARLRLDGTRSPVPWAGPTDNTSARNAGVRNASARNAVVSARSAETGATVLVVVDLTADGLGRTDELAVTGEPTQTLTFEGVTVDAAAVLGGVAPGVAPGDGQADRHTAEAPEEVAHWVGRRAQALLLATVQGVCEEALALTARYVAERRQFDTPIGTFQAVAHRAADSYIDVEALRLACLQALWRLDAGSRDVPAVDVHAVDVDEALATATFWACEAGHRVVHAAQHLHGGIGVDTDYPVHRYYRRAKAAEGLLGGATGAARALGDALASGKGNE